MISVLTQCISLFATDKQTSKKSDTKCFVLGFLSISFYDNRMQPFALDYI